MTARGYEFYLRVLKLSLKGERSERVRCFQHDKIKFASPSVKAFAGQSESCIVYIQIASIAFQIWRLFYRRLLQIFLRRPSKALDCASWLLPRRVCMASRKRELIEHITERCLIAKKSFSFKERAALGEIETIGARDVDVFYRQFSDPSA